MRRVLMHGLVIESDIPLPDCVDAPPGPADVAFRAGAPGEVPAVSRPGRVLARLPRTDGDGAFFTVTQDEDWTMRVHGVCDVVIDRGLDAATFHLDPRADPAMASVLAGGLVVSTLLILRGHLVLHAGAVQTESGVVAVTGASGMGKSTVSTLLCRAGARLVTDDVLRVDIGTDGIRCRLGSGETRLRPAAGSLLTAEDDVRRTADGRTALSLPRATADPLPLRCVVIPSPDRGAATVEAVRHGQVDALLRVAAFPRVLGWEDPTTRGQQFTLAGDLVARVPVLTVRLPWGPPFRSGLGREVLDVLP